MPRPATSRRARGQPDEPVAFLKSTRTRRTSRERKRCTVCLGWYPPDGIDECGKCDVCKIQPTMLDLPPQPVKRQGLR